MIVPDASSVIEVLLQTERGQRLETRLLHPAETLHVPHLIDIEVAHVLRRVCLQGLLDPQRGAEAIEDLAALPLIRYSHDLFLPRIWTLRHTLTAYDATYVALAEVLSAPLLTCDTRLAASHGHEAIIEVVA